MHGASFTQIELNNELEDNPTENRGLEEGNGIAQLLLDHIDQCQADL